MTDPRETLARIREQANNATEGPWTVDPFTWKPGHPIPSSEWLGIEATGPVKGEVARIQPNDGEGDADAEFIAAARTDVPALLDALEKVLELHQPVTDGMGFTEDGYGGISPACSSCGTSDEYAVPYPCPTVTAITTALEATK